MPYHEVVHYATNLGISGTMYLCIMDDPLCGVCGHAVDPGTDHVKVEAETVYIHDRNQQDSYFLHLECALRTIDAWQEPI